MNLLSNLRYEMCEVSPRGSRHQDRIRNDCEGKWCEAEERGGPLDHYTA